MNSNTFIGGAGVGKSTLIKAINQTVTRYFKRKPGVNPNTSFVFLAAPTGKAAFNIDGNTLHSLFQIPINQQERQFIPLSNDTANTLFSIFINVKVIIIDEISMVGTKLFYYLNFRLQQIFKSDKLFGGISIIVLGDFKQLPPVGDAWIFTPYKNDTYSLLIGNPLWELFKYFELTEVMRQKDDLDFAVALNNLGEGTLTDNDVKMFKSRVLSPANIPQEAIHLFVTNNEVDHFNNIKLNSIHSTGYESIAHDTISGKLPQSQIEFYLKAVKIFKISDTYGLPSSLLLKKDIKYMLTTNINTSDGLVNGAIGVLKKIDLIHKNEKNIPTKLWFEFDKECIGKVTRMKYGIQNLLTPIELSIKSFQYKQKKDIRINRRQFPIKCAESMTIHKSQGSTYKCICVHNNKHCNVN